MPVLPTITPDQTVRDELEDYRFKYTGIEKNNLDQLLILMEVVRETSGRQSKVNIEVLASSLKIRINPRSYTKIGEFADLVGYQELFSLLRQGSQHLHHLIKQYNQLSDEQLHYLIDIIILNILELKKHLAFRYV